MKRGDWLLALILLAAAAWFLVPRLTDGQETDGAAKYAEITVNGQHYRTVELTEAEQVIDIRTSRGHNVLRVSGGAIEMIEADCPDDLCIVTGPIRKTGEKIVCLPNRVFVEIGSHAGTGDDADAVVA